MDNTKEIITGIIKPIIFNSYQNPFYPTNENEIGKQLFKCINNIIDDDDNNNNEDEDENENVDNKITAFTYFTRKEPFKLLPCEMVNYIYDVHNSNPYNQSLLTSPDANTSYVSYTGFYDLNSFVPKYEYFNENIKLSTSMHQKDTRKSFNAHSYEVTSYSKRLFNEVYNDFLDILEYDKQTDYIIDDFSGIFDSNKLSYITTEIDGNKFTCSLYNATPKNNDVTNVTSKYVALSYDGKINNYSINDGYVKTFSSIDYTLNKTTVVPGNINGLADIANIDLNNIICNINIKSKDNSTIELDEKTFNKIKNSRRLIAKINDVVYKDILLSENDLSCKFDTFEISVNEDHSLTITTDNYPISAIIILVDYSAANAEYFDVDFEPLHYKVINTEVYVYNKYNDSSKARLVIDCKNAKLLSNATVKFWAQHKDNDEYKKCHKNANQKYAQIWAKTKCLSEDKLEIEFNYSSSWHKYLKSYNNYKYHLSLINNVDTIEEINKTNIDIYDISFIPVENPVFDVKLKKDDDGNTKIREINNRIFAKSGDIIEYEQNISFTDKTPEFIKNRTKIVSVNIKSATSSIINLMPKIYFNEIDNIENFSVICLSHGTFNVNINIYNPVLNRIETIQKTIDIKLKDFKSNIVLLTGTSDNKNLVFGFSNKDNCVWPASIIPYEHIDYDITYDFGKKEICVTSADEIKKYYIINPDNSLDLFEYNNDSKKDKNSKSKIEVIALEDEYDEYGDNSNENSVLYSVKQKRYILPQIKISLSILNSKTKQTGKAINYREIFNKLKPNEFININYDESETLGVSSMSYHDIDSFIIDSQNCEAWNVIPSVVTTNYSIKYSLNPCKEKNYSTFPIYKTQNNFILKLSDTHSRITTNKQSFNIKIGLTNNDYIILDFNVDELCVIDKGERKILNLIDIDSLKISGILDSQEMVLRNTYNCEFNDLENKINVTESNNKGLEISFESEYSNKCIDISFLQRDYLVVTDNILIENKPVETDDESDETEDKSAEAENSENNFLDNLVFKESDYNIKYKNLGIQSVADISDKFEEIYGITENNFIININPEENFDFLINLKNVDIYALTQTKLLKLFSDIDYNYIFNIKFNELFNEFKHIYSIIISGIRETNYELDEENSDDEEQVKNDELNERIFYKFDINRFMIEKSESNIIKNRIERIPVYDYHDVASNWLIDGEYDNLLPDEFFYPIADDDSGYSEYYVFAYSSNIPSTKYNTLLEINNDRSVVCTYWSENNNNISYTYAKQDMTWNGSLRYNPPTIDYVGYHIYYMFLNILKNDGWTKNIDTSDFIYHLLDLDKLSYEKSENNSFVMPNVLYHYKDYTQKMSLTEYFSRYVNNIIKYWENRIKHHERLYEILNFQNDSLSIDKQIAEYLNVIKYSSDVKKQRLEYLLNEVCLNENGENSTLKYYAENKIWNYAIMTYFWYSFITILLEDEVDFNYINNDILNDLFNYGFKKNIDVAEIENNRFKRYSIVEEDSHTYKIVELNDEEYDKEKDKIRYEYSYGKNNEIINIVKRFPKNEPIEDSSYWKFNLDDIIANNNNKTDDKFKYTYKFDEKEGVFYRTYKNEKPDTTKAYYINIHGELKLGKIKYDSSDNKKEWHRKYGNYITNDNGIIKRILGKHNKTFVYSNKDVNNYWIEFDKKYLVKVNKKDVFTAIQNQVYLNKLFVNELKKMYKMVSLLEKNNKLNDIYEEITRDYGNNSYNVLIDTVTKNIDFESSRLYSSDSYINYSFDTYFKEYSCSYGNITTNNRKYHTSYAHIPISYIRQRSFLSYSYNDGTNEIITHSLVPGFKESDIVIKRYDDIKSLYIKKPGKRGIYVYGKNINDNRPTMWGNVNTNINWLKDLDVNYYKIANYSSVDTQSGYDNTNNIAKEILNNRFKDYNDSSLYAPIIAYSYILGSKGLLRYNGKIYKYDEDTTYATYDSSYGEFSYPNNHIISHLLYVSNNIVYAKVYFDNTYIEVSYTYYENSIPSLQTGKYFTNSSKITEFSNDNGINVNVDEETMMYWEKNNNENITYPTKDCKTYKFLSSEFEDIKRELHNRNDNVLVINVNANSYLCEPDETKFYLGSVTEWQIVQDCAHELNAYATYENLNWWQPLYDGNYAYDYDDAKYFWTSTEIDTQRAWPMFMTDSFDSNCLKSNNYFVRPFVKYEDKTNNEEDEEINNKEEEE